MSNVIALSPTRRRFALALLLILIPCVIINFTSIPDMHDEVLLQNSVAELQVRLENLRMKYAVSQEEMHRLTQQLMELTENNRSLQDLQLFLGNSTSNATSVKLPSVYSFLPHLLNDPASLRPSFILGKGRTDVSIVLGIPHTKREVQNYLMPTLKNLLERMSVEEVAEITIVVMVAETDMEYITYVAKQIEVQFPDQVKSGVIEVIAPPASFYPDFAKVRDTLGDDHQRVVWRSKQNLDFAFLMSYAQPKGTFYVQLEDDIIAKQHFVTTMKSYALQKISKKEHWFVLDFCQLGFIGKMFKTAELPWFVQFFLMFYSNKPVDWLLDDLITVRVCGISKESKQCKAVKAETWVHYKPSLFQHIGVYSSLKGKVQKLKDKQFGKIPQFYPHSNPEAVLESQIKPFKQYTLQKAYKGENFFWGLLPQPGDHLSIKFKNPVYIKKYLFRSGNAEHPSDKFYNTTIEVLPESLMAVSRNDSDVSADGYIVIGKFDALGIASGNVDKKLGKIAALRFKVHSESENWAILSEPSHAQLFNLESYIDSVISVERIQKISSVFLIHPGDDFGDLNDIPIFTMIQSITLEQSKHAIRSIATTFQHLDAISKYHEEKMIPPLSVVFFTNEKSLSEFQIPSYTRFSKWLLIFLVSDSCEKPEKNEFHFNLQSEVIVRCKNDTRLQWWKIISNEEIEVSDFTEIGITSAISDIRTKMNVSVLQDVKSVYEEDGKFGGYFGEMFQVLREAMNLEIEQIFREKYLGGLDKNNGSFYGVIGKIMIGEAEMCVEARVVSNDRADFVDFTQPVAVSPSYLYLKQPDHSVVWQAYIQAFDTGIWLATIASIILLTLATILIEHFLNAHHFSYISVWGFFCQQNSTKPTTFTSLQVIFIVSSLTSFVILAAYAAFLLSFLAYSKPTLPFSNLEGFSRDGSFGLIFVRDSAGLAYFKSGDGKIMKRLGNLIKNEMIATNSMGFKQVCEEEVAFFASEVVYFTEASSMSCEVLPVETGQTQNFAMMLKKNSPYTRLVNFYTQRMISAGILSRLKQKYKPTASDADSYEVHSIGLWNVLPIFTFFAFGILLALMILIIEYFMPTKQRKPE